MRSHHGRRCEQHGRMKPLLINAHVSPATPKEADLVPETLQRRSARFERDVLPYLDQL
jgi:hypothetical protein